MCLCGELLRLRFLGWKFFANTKSFHISTRSFISLLFLLAVINLNCNNSENNNQSTETKTISSSPQDDIIGTQWEGNFLSVIFSTNGECQVKLQRMNYGPDWWTSGFIHGTWSIEKKEYERGKFKPVIKIHGQFPSPWILEKIDYNVMEATAGPNFSDDIHDKLDLYDNLKLVGKTNQNEIGQKVVIIDDGQIYPTINQNNDFVWPSEEIKRMAGENYWGTFTPLKGDTGTIISTLFNDIYLIKINNYYVPIGKSGVQFK